MDLGKIGTTNLSSIRPNVKFSSTGLLGKKLLSTAAKESGFVSKAVNTAAKEAPATGNALRDKLATFFEKFNKYEGEMTSILINSLGTAIAAPIVIAYNPVSKEDDKTKKYTALRQPLSGVLALVTQIGVNYKAQNTIQKMGENGQLAGLNNYLHAQPGLLKEYGAEKELLKVLQKMEDKKKTSLLSSTASSKDIGSFIEDLKAGDSEITTKYIKELKPCEQKEKLSELAKKYTGSSITTRLEILDGKKGLIDNVIGNAESTKDLAKKIEKIVGQDNKIESLLDKKDNVNKIKERLEELISKKNTKVDQKTLEELLGKKGLIQELELKAKNLKQFKTVTGTTLSLLTLIPTSMVLNWVYPRFVERFFPHLAKKSDTKATEGKK